MRDTPRNTTYLYLVLVLALSPIFYAPMLRSGRMIFWAVFGIMWCPGLAALITCRIAGRSLRTLGWHWPKGRYIVLGYFVPLGYATVAYGAVWALRLGGWNAAFLSQIAHRRGLPPWGVLPFFILMQATLGMVMSLTTALGEEIGWRGFLVPELAKQMSFTKVSLVSGVVWAVWHWPAILFLNYNAGTNGLYALCCFTVMVVAISFIFAWVRLKSGSLWPAALLHASGNLFIQDVFDRLMRDTGRTRWYTTEFGIALAVTSVLFAVYFWRRRSEVEQVGTKIASAYAT